MLYMEAMDCIKGRTTVRSFKQDDIPEPVMHDLLEAAIAAPSAGNTQDWDFVVVRNPATKKQLSEASMGQVSVVQAPVVLVICSNLKKIKRIGTRGEELFTLQDTAAAAQNIMLAAWSIKIGTCWVGGFNEGKVRQAIALPEHVRPVILLAMGYPADEPTKPKRWPLQDFIHKEHYTEK